MPEAPLPIHGWFVDTSSGAPVVVVDASGCQDLLDYCAALTESVGGRITAHWYNTKSPNGELLLSVMTLTPRVCRFGVQFDLPEQLNLVTILASAEQVLIVPAEFHPGTVQDDLPPVGVIIGSADRVVIKDALARVAR